MQITAVVLGQTATAVVPSTTHCVEKSVHCLHFKMGKNFGDTWGNFCRFSENLFKTKQPQKSIYTRLWLLSLSLNSDQMSCTEMKIISISVQHICNCDSSSTSLARLSSASRSLPALSGLKWWDYGDLERCYRCETEESAFYKQLLYYKNVHI